ncbi:hypothetical protein ACHAWX_006478 [Stephanocyclus meneghinianus]
MRPFALTFIFARPTLCSAFKYESTKPWELLAPHTLCASGIPGGLLGPCPQNVEETNAYDAIVMDEHGYVDVTISGLHFMSNKSQRRELVDEADREAIDNEGGAQNEESMESGQDHENSVPLQQEEKVQESNASIHSDKDTSGTESLNLGTRSDGDENSNKQEPDKPKEENSPNSKSDVEHASIAQAGNDSNIKLAYPNKFHIQVYLVSIDVESNPLTSQAQHAVQSDREFDFISHNGFLSGNGLCCYEYAVEAKNDKDHPEIYSKLMKQCTPMDMRPLVPRMGMNQKISAPLSISNASFTQEVVVSARFRPVVRGRHMVVISNCAVEVNDAGDVTPLTAHFNKIKFKFVSKFGELPLSMMGIVPFYGVLLALYGLLGLIWFRRSKGAIGCPSCKILRWKKESSHLKSRTQARPLLGLQRAIFSLVLLQFAFTFVAFAYYVHLNITVVDIDILYGGTMAALASVTPFSILVGMVHFVTFLACQAVVMLATDGTWLIQSSIRPDTKKALYALGAAWACFFATNTFLSRKTRLIIISSLGLTWVAFLVFNVRRSLRHLRSLILGQSNETVIAVGGNLVAKRSMYRKFFAIVAIYPLVFAAGVIWNAECQEDSWAWVGYVLVDVYVFIILLHASIAWLPRPLAAMEYAKYTPLDHNNSSSSINDPGVWEEEINYNFDDLEL